MNPAQKLLCQLRDAVTKQVEDSRHGKPLDEKLLATRFTKAIHTFAEFVKRDGKSLCEEGEDWKREGE